MVQNIDSVLDFEYRLWICFRSGTLGYSNICNTKRVKQLTKDFSTKMISFFPWSFWIPTNLKGRKKEIRHISGKSTNSYLTNCSIWTTDRRRVEYTENCFSDLVDSCSTNQFSQTWRAISSVCRKSLLLPHGRPSAADSPFDMDCKVIPAATFRRCWDDPHDVIAWIAWNRSATICYEVRALTCSFV